MPKYEGTVYRSVSEFGIDEEEFEKRYAVGNSVLELSYISTSTGTYDDSMKYQFVINSKSGRDVRNFNTEEQEILFKRGSMFKVTKRDGDVFFLEEV